MEIKLGVFAVPDATDPSTTVEQLLAADRSGLDVVDVQDHPRRARRAASLGEDVAPRVRELVG